MYAISKMILTLVPFLIFCKTIIEIQSDSASIGSHEGTCASFGIVGAQEHDRCTDLPPDQCLSIPSHGSNRDHSGMLTIVTLNSGPKLCNDSQWRKIALKKHNSVSSCKKNAGRSSCTILLSLAEKSSSFLNIFTKVNGCSNPIVTHESRVNLQLYFDVTKLNSLSSLPEMCAVKLIAARSIANTGPCFVSDNDPEYMTLQQTLIKTSSGPHFVKKTLVGQSKRTNPKLRHHLQQILFKFKKESGQDMVLSFGISLPNLTGSELEMGFQVDCLSKYGDTLFQTAPVFPMSLKTRFSYKPSAPRNLQLSSLSVFPDSSMYFKLAWSCPMRWNGNPSHYKLTCSFLNVESLFCYPEECNRCIQKSNKKDSDCNKCWQFARKANGQKSAILSRIPWSSMEHQTYLHISQPNISSTSVHDAHQKFHIIKYKVHGRNGCSDTSTLPPTIADIVVIPGKTCQMELLRERDISETFALCRIKGVLKTGHSGSWSESLLFQFDNIQPKFNPAVLAAWNMVEGKRDQTEFADYAPLHFGRKRKKRTYEDGSVAIYDFWYMPSFISFASRKLAESKERQLVAHTIKELENLNPAATPSMPNPPSYVPNHFQGIVGCYHWIFRMWYVFIWNVTANYFNLATYLDDISGDSVGYEFSPKVTSTFASGYPVQMKCSQTRAFIIWSEYSQNGTIILNGLTLNQNSGQPVRELQISQESLCPLLHPLSSPIFELTNDKKKEAIVLVCSKYLLIRSVESSDLPFLKSLSLAPYESNCKRITWIAMKSSTLFYFKNDSLNLNVIFFKERKKQTVSKFQTIEKEQPESLVTKPGISLWRSRTKEISKTNAKEAVWLQSYETAETINIAPAKCIYPLMESVTMRWQHDMKFAVRVSAKWNDDFECKQRARPHLMFQLEFALLSDLPQTAEAPVFSNSDPATSPIKAILEAKGTYSCSSQGCRKKFSRPQRTLSAVIPINLSTWLESKIVYYFKVTAVPYLNETYMDIWFSGYKPHFKEKFYKIVCHDPEVFKRNKQQDIAILSSSIVISIFIALGLAGCVVCYTLAQKKKYQYRTLHRLYVHQISRSNVIGEGNFGEVWKGDLYQNKKKSSFMCMQHHRNKSQIVVIKTLKENATEHEERQFRDEALLLSKLQSEFIIRVMGICLQSRPIMLALEYMNGGSLDKFLRRQEIRNQLGLVHLLDIVQDALKACIYLESLGYIHRDIAARNVLLQIGQENSSIPKKAKLSDFGMAKDIGIYASEYSYPVGDRRMHALPVAWTAPEGFQGRFSTKSDAWSFGVLIWEVFSYASIPFGPCSSCEDCTLPTYSHAEIEEMVCLQGMSLMGVDLPCNAVFSDQLKEIMSRCWTYEITRRISFSELEKCLQTGQSDILKGSSVVPREQRRRKFQRILTPTYSGSESYLEVEQIPSCVYSPKIAKYYSTIPLTLQGPLKDSICVEQDVNEAQSDNETYDNV